MKPFDLLTQECNYCLRRLSTEGWQQWPWNWKNIGRRWIWRGEKRNLEVQEGWGGCQNCTDQIQVWGWGELYPSIQPCQLFVL